MSVANDYRLPIYYVRSNSMAQVQKVVKESLEALHNRVEFVTFDEAKMTGTFVRMPARSELNAEINESLVVEFYNRG